MTLVCAPAGFGKTTLVAEWLGQFREADEPDQLPFGWLSLERSDNHLPVFLRYLLAALQTIQAGMGEATREMLESNRLPPHETLLLPLLNDLYSLTKPSVLILDDYHSIQDPAIHEAVAYLLERLPPAIHTIITSRQDPLLPLARWRARGQLTDIRLVELRFNETEAADFLNRTMGLNLVASDISALEAHTEGWIAGLQMAAISLQQVGPDCENTDTSAFIAAFTGDDRFVMDYLVDEVLCRQPSDVQDFLLKTAVLERFNTSLCEAVLGTTTGESVQQGISDVRNQLAYLEEVNLFLISLDNRRQWYRYHHLFAELLRYRLETSYGSAFVAELQQRASRWYDDNHLPEQAIQYAQAAQNWTLSGQLILKYSPPLIRQGELMTLLRWLRAMPEWAVHQNPYLCRDYGYALTQTGQLKAGKALFDLAEQGLSNDPEHLGRMLVFASHNALFRGEFTEEIALARRGLELLNPEDDWMRGSAALSLGMGLLHSGDPYNAEAACLEALRAGQQSGAERTCINALAQLGRISVLRLDFAQAEIYFQRAVQYRSNGQPYPGCDMPFLDLAMLKYEQNALDEPEDYITQGMEANNRSNSIEMRAYGYRLKARLHQLKGSAAEAEEYLQKALKLAVGYDLSPLTLSLNAALQVEMALTDGDLRQAELAAPRVTNSLGVYPFAFYPETTRVHLLLVLGKTEEALKLLEPALSQAEQPGWEYPRLQVRVLQALGTASPTKAYQFLLDALTIAYPAGAVRSFLDLGEPMRLLLLECAPRVESPHLKTFVQELLSLFSHSPSKPASEKPASRNQDLIEPLSDREIEVLCLLADGLSNAEIATQLYLSPNTLKAHTQNIYSKLDVHSRVQAVNRARELKII